MKRLLVVDMLRENNFAGQIFQQRLKNCYRVKIVHPQSKFYFNKLKKLFSKYNVEIKATKKKIPYGAWADFSGYSIYIPYDSDLMEVVTHIEIYNVKQRKAEKEGIIKQIRKLMNKHKILLSELA